MKRREKREGKQGSTSVQSKSSTCMELLMSASSWRMWLSSFHCIPSLLSSLISIVGVGTHQFDVRHGSTCLWFKRRIYLLCEYLECSNILPGAWRME